MSVFSSKHAAWMLLAFVALGAAGCQRMLPNSGVKTVVIARVEETEQRLLLQSGDDRIIHTIVSAIDSRREVPLKVVPEYFVTLEYLDGTATLVGVHESSLVIEGKTFSSPINIGDELATIVARSPTARSQPNVSRPKPSSELPAD